MPSPIVRHPTTGLMHAGAERVARELKEGNGADWPGDPRLYLAMNVVRHPVRTEILGRRYEAWRTMEDGRTELIGHWRLEEFDQIIPDLVKMRMDSPAWVPAEQRVDENNARQERANADAYVDRMGPMMEHLQSLKKHHSPHEAQDVFYMNDRKKA